MGIITALKAVFTFFGGTVGAGFTAANLVAGVVTAGIAVGTARQLGTYLKPNLGAMNDPGTRIQLPPGTENKVPVLYGTAWTSGPIIDVNISNSNDLDKPLIKKKNVSFKKEKIVDTTVKDDNVYCNSGHIMRVLK